MSLYNLLFCRGILINTFKSSAGQKTISFGLNKINLKYKLNKRFLTNTVHNEKWAEKDSNLKSDNLKSVNVASTHTKDKKDLQLPANDDPDVFGTLNKNFLLERKLAEMPEEEGDVEETIFYNEEDLKVARLTINKYARMIKHFLNKKKLHNALAVLEIRMLKEDKVVPDRYIFNLLISGCAKYGYTQKAFQLFNQMKKRGLKPSPSTYTSLLNSCSTSPWNHDGLKRLKRLREVMLEKAYKPNQQNYHAMIKAYGRCNDLNSAFNIVDEMLDNKIRVTIETFNFLLQSCITDSEAGLRHAILVWNKMLSKGIRPDLYSFNLMVRCARDCGLGNLEATAEVIKQVTDASNTTVVHLIDGLKDNQNKMTSIEGKEHTEESNKIALINDQTDCLPVINRSDENRPNLLSRYPYMGDIIGISDIKLPEHRLVLLGGYDGFLKEMQFYNIKPDIKTFTQLLETIPSTISAEQSLLNSLEENNIKPDIDFFNILIKKRSMRCDYQNARAVLQLIQKNILSPDIVTFGVLALSCFSIEEMDQLFNDMDEIGYRMNIQILGALLRNATLSWDIDYIKKVMQLVVEESVTPSPQFMGYLAAFYSSVNRYLNIEDNKQRDLSEDDKKFIGMVNDPLFMRSFKSYCAYFKKWRLKAIPEEPEHPYKQFKQKHEDPEDIAVMNTGRKFINSN